MTRFISDCDIEAACMSHCLKSVTVKHMSLNPPPEYQVRAHGSEITCHPRLPGNRATNFDRVSNRNGFQYRKESDSYDESHLTHTQPLFRPVACARSNYRAIKNLPQETLFPADKR
jgi:hypothetical protein